MERDDPDSLRLLREKLRNAAKASGLSQQEIGEKMGLAAKDARKAVSRLLGQKGYDPRISTIQKFAEAIGKRLSEII